jgi:hypothetical protein
VAAGNDHPAATALLPAATDIRRAALSDDQERQLRIMLMMTQAERLRQEIRTDTRKFLVQLLAGTAAAMAAGAAIFGIILHLTGRL